MFGNAWRIGRIAGVELRIDVSWTLIAVLVAYSLFLRFEALFPDLAIAGSAVLGVVSAILFFGSVLFHELAHAILARRRGIEVRSITLFLFGGATHAKVESRGPGAELMIAAVGPLSSLVLAGAFAGAAALADGILAEPIVTGLGYLGFVNLLLAGFNLVPGFPLDGGRVLRAIIWKATGSLERATRIASRSGQGVGYLLGGAGLFLAFRGAFVSGIWLVAIGWFLAAAARVSGEQTEVRRLLRDVEATDVMTEIDGSARVGPETPMTEVVETLEREDVDRVLVVDDGEIRGIITSNDVDRWLKRRGRAGASPSRTG